MNTKKCLLPLLGTLALLASAESINYINMYVRLNEEASCGLNRLTASERGRLNEVFRKITERLDDNLRNSALAYLRNSGWSELEVTGTAAGEGEAMLVTATRAGQRYRLEPTGVSTLMPGTYLARLDSGRCEVIDPQGRAVEFRVMP